ncbi:glycerol-3-phosphate 1-O-acyltransferase PlsB [Noviherbaspirillum galbum]|uniref:Glycerol-3-phosphate acyltransferase n=1 Tax=Noviherbaspirillum galbum TaxID=2709383 RepID=A0A6B3SZA2_9BURK|nr:glycerol-3-phosphate 1-O-acyltransferase PlsB [Noviherbaspirillum galbum]NEX64502.1 glycerol-3-phosphate 1-O-acyltransferase PlsB [Noviherbaspirillum galbum]
MPSLFGLDRPLLHAVSKLLYLWSRPRVLPADAAQLGLKPELPVIYVLQQRFLPNTLLLNEEAKRLGLPSPLGSLTLDGMPRGRSFFFLARPEPWLSRARPRHSSLLTALVDRACRQRDFDAQIVPVTILWGRAPDKKDSIWKQLFSEDWANRGTLKQMITLVLHGREPLVRFSEAVSLHEVIGDTCDHDTSLRRINRVLRRHFREQREMAIGPDLSHRRTRISDVLAAAPVQAAIEAEARAQGGSPEARAKAERCAREYAWEIAADYSHPVVRVLDRLLTWLWTRLYDGVAVHRFDTVGEVAQGQEVVYVPSHRSHIDYLLLSYVVYHRGLMVPHIAAGANLDLPVVGGILRRGGAFFLRRSFKGNKLYAAVFNEYLHMMIAKGYSIEYFIEGGRSRTGRLLEPKAGMLAMTVQSFLREPARPIVFVPIYIGYEKLFEGRTYIGELMGRPKKKESLLDLLLSVRELKKNFGKVHLNFGEPVRLPDILDAAHPGWREEPQPDEDRTEARPAWLGKSIERLMRRLSTGINAAAVIGPVNLVSLALLATPRHAMDAHQLVRLLDAYRRLAAALPYSPQTQLTGMDGAAMLDYCESLKLVQRQPHPLGDIIHFPPEEAVLCSYARNNVLHAFATPALVASIATRHAAMTRGDLSALSATVYPFLRAELFLRWSAAEFDGMVQAHADALAGTGWLARQEDGRLAPPSLNSEQYVQLNLLGQAIRPTLMRYFITLATMTRRGSGSLTPAELESLCHLQAQRLSLLREFNAPEFFDKAIFRTFIATLGKTGFASLDDDGRLRFDERLAEAAALARFVLPPDASRAILQMTQ